MHGESRSAGALHHLAHRSASEGRNCHAMLRIRHQRTVLGLGREAGSGVSLAGGATERAVARPPHAVRMQFGVRSVARHLQWAAGAVATFAVVETPCDSPSVESAAVCWLSLRAQWIVRGQVVHLGKQRLQIAVVLRRRILGNVHRRSCGLRLHRLIMRHAQILQHLLRHFLEYRRGDR